MPSPPPPPLDAGTGTDASALCSPWYPFARHVVPCNTPARPPWTILAPGGTFDTTDGTFTGGEVPASTLITQQGGIMLRVISVESFGVEPGATLRVIGAHPLLVLSWSTIAISGMIDASSLRGDSSVEKGAGADRSLGCQIAEHGQGSEECGGGGGGGFSAGGGSGGDGQSSANNGGEGGSSVARPKIVAGGCRGGTGGGGTSAGAAGSGGGAIQLTARKSIEITSGGIHTGGSGGQGGRGNGGGGGGGSGGFIGLDAPKVVVDASAILAANGGGGGTGCADGSGPSGADALLGTARASGGPGGIGAGCLIAVAGGRGGAADSTAGEGGTSSIVSGGGGGGGVGYILVWSTSVMFKGAASPSYVRVPL